MRRAALVGFALVCLVGTSLLTRAREAHADEPSMSLIVPDGRRGETMHARLVIEVPPSSWLVAPGAKGTPLSWTLKDGPEGVTWGVGETPEPTTLGGSTGHRGRVEVSIPVTVGADAPLGSHSLLSTVIWQRCTADFCASTLRQQLPVSIRVLDASPPPEKKPLPVR
ncbi:MAG: hypothetical protein KDA24_06115 [Deltaproteobacteria bacterium]|nr:hypothetical protein [Deltaproteobacteria bacterium]